MKVGIITCHDVFNAGSSLQAYALSKFIAELGTEVEIINYKPDYMYRLIDFMEVDGERWKKTFAHRWAYRLRLLPYRLSLLPKYLQYRSFNRKYLNMTRKTYRTMDDLMKIEAYDVLICGSDQIWASVKNNCGEDPAFYLGFCTKSRKIAYAASFGAAEISREGERRLKEYLPDFAAISTREKSGVQILKGYGFEAQQVLDPVFLKDKDFWTNHCVAPDKAPDDYVLVYGYDNSINMDELGSQYAQEKGLQMVSLKPGNKYALGGPENFLWLIKNAKMVITSSFHATAFSVIFETPFVAVQTSNKALFERIISVLDLFGLQGRLWNTDCNIDRMPPTDYDQCRRRLALAKEESAQFLLGALYGSESK